MFKFSPDYFALGFFVIILGFVLFSIMRQIKYNNKKRDAIESDLPADDEVVEVVFRKTLIQMTQGQKYEWDMMTTDQKKQSIEKWSKKYQTWKKKKNLW